MGKAANDRSVCLSDGQVTAVLAGETRLAVKPRGTRAYAAGERLWVKEAYAEVHPAAVDWHRESYEGRAGIPGPPPLTYRVVYRADGPVPPVFYITGYPYRSLESDGGERIQEYGFDRFIRAQEMERQFSRMSIHVDEASDIDERGWQVITVSPEFRKAA